MTNSHKMILLGFIISLTNYWIWKVFKEDYLIGLLLVSLSILLLYLSNIKFNRKIFFVLCIICLIISYRTLLSGFDNGFRILSFDQENKLNERHIYFANDLGGIFQNKFALRFYKDVAPYISVYQSNIFNSLSPSLYFFANHPREREKVHEFNLYFPLLILPFLVGLMMFLNKSNLLISGYIIFAILMTGFISQNYIFGPVLFFPLVNFFIATGLIKISNFFII